MAKGSRSKLKTALIVVVALVILAIAGVVAYAMSLGHDKPTGQPGEKAEALAKEVLKAIGDEGWKKTGAIRWDFPRGHKHVWDRQRNYAWVRWGSTDALVNLADKDGLVRQHGKLIGGDAKKQLLTKAWAIWANDSFWLNPVSKMMDDGVTRSYVKMDSGEDALLVSYASGGVTPGDSYLWILNENKTPKAWRMWVSIIPVGGLEFTWEGWTILSTGVKIAPNHEGAVSINLKNIKAAPTMKELLGSDPDPFPVLEKYLAERDKKKK